MCLTPETADRRGTYSGVCNRRIHKVMLRHSLYASMTAGLKLRVATNIYFSYIRKSYVAVRGSVHGSTFHVAGIQDLTS